MTVGTSYTAVGQALSAGSADIGFISGGNYVLFSDDCDVLLTALRYGINKDSDDPKDWNDGTIEENTDEMSTYYRSIILAGPSEKGQALLEKVNNGEELTWDYLNDATWAVMGPTSASGYIYPSLWLNEKYGKGISDLANAVEQTIEELADTLGMDKEQLTTLLQDSVKEPEEPVIVVEQESAAPVTDMQQESIGDQEVQTATTTDIEAEQPRETKRDENGNMQQQMQDMQKPAENLQQTQGSAIAAEQTTERFDLQRTQKIIDQIADYVKIHSGEKLTSCLLYTSPSPRD